jgi:hypothetical protein
MGTTGYWKERFGQTAAAAAASSSLVKTEASPFALTEALLKTEALGKTAAAVAVVTNQYPDVSPFALPPHQSVAWAAARPGKAASGVPPPAPAAAPIPPAPQAPPHAAAAAAAFAAAAAAVAAAVATTVQQQQLSVQAMAESVLLEHPLDDLWGEAAMTWQSDLMMAGAGLLPLQPPHPVLPEVQHHLLIRSDKAKSGYKGVHPHRGRFEVKCATPPCHHNHLGSFDIPEEAAQAYLQHQQQNHSHHSAMDTWFQCGDCNKWRRFSAAAGHTIPDLSEEEQWCCKDSGGLYTCEQQEEEEEEEEEVVKQGGGKKRKHAQSPEPKLLFVSDQLHADNEALKKAKKDAIDAAVQQMISGRADGAAAAAGLYNR